MIKPDLGGVEPHLTFVTTIATAGCVKKNCGNSSSQIAVVYKKDKYQVWPAVTGSPTPKSTNRHPCADEAAEKKVVQLFVLPL